MVFLLRAEDMYRIKGEWFTETKDGWFCDLQILKEIDQNTPPLITEKMQSVL